MTSAQVFLSSPGIHTDQTASVEGSIRAELRRQGIPLLRVERDQYQLPPWEQLRGAVSGSDGAVVLGIRQLRVVVGELRPGTQEAQPHSGWRASAWNQLEAGMAIMARIPVLVVPEPQVTEGVFSCDVWGGHVYGLRCDSREAARIRSDQVFQLWLDAVVSHAAERTRP